MDPSLPFPSVGFHLFSSIEFVTFVKRLFGTMNKRLLQFLQAENISQAQLADTLSVARGSVSHILSGRNRPGFDFIESLLLHYPSLNLDWLITGKGRMYREDAEDSPQINIPSGSKVSKIMVFYDDGTFEEFHKNG